MSRKGEFDPLEFDKLITNAKNAQKDIQGVIKNIGENTKIAKQELTQQIISMVDQSMQQVSSIMSSLSEITQNQYEAQISEQEKYIEQYEKLLDKQKEATQKYADEVNSIEDELKTARGDRRQELIDQLNAQMSAQRASLAEEKRIEKQKEKAEEQKKKLEHDQAVAKKRMDLAQAYINAAMAVSMAAVNKWPIPAVPMMAMAAAAAAAQIAAIKSQNIPSYGDGGVIQGKSHAQGGVKVLGGSAEVEGGEFITNKATTQNNVELLDFINSKKKKLNLSDMFEFYGGKTSNVRKVINNASPMKFADGGQVPLLSNDIELNDRLVNVMEDYSNRPVVVSVVDINDRQAAVRNVEVLSGLNE
jgi:DNA gyrase/topoisomerase IV subunit A